MSGSSTCKYCGRPIVWAKTARDKNFCVDPNPRPAGEFVLEATGTSNGRVQFSVRRARADDPANKRYVAHFKSCPNRLKEDIWG